MGVNRHDGGQIFFAVFFAKFNLSPVFEAPSLSCFVELMGTLRFGVFAYLPIPPLLTTWLTTWVAGVSPR